MSGAGGPRWVVAGAVPERSVMSAGAAGTDSPRTRRAAEPRRRPAAGRQRVAGVRVPVPADPGAGRATRSTTTSASASGAASSLRWYGEMFAQRPRHGRAAELDRRGRRRRRSWRPCSGTAAALSIERFRYRGQRAFDGLLYLPVIIPDITMAVMLLLFFVQALRPDLPGHRRPVQPRARHDHAGRTSRSTSRSSRWWCAPGCAGLDGALEEAAADLYASRWQAFRRVTLPLIAPGRGRRCAAGADAVARRRGGHRVRRGAGVDDAAGVRVRAACAAG